MQLKYYRRSLVSIGVSLVLLIALWFSFHHKTSSSSNATVSTELALPATTSTTAAVKTAAGDKTDWHVRSIESGDNLASIFKKQHIPAAMLQTLLKNKLAKQYLTNLKPGQTLQLQIHNNALTRLNYEFSINQKLSIAMQDNKVNSKIITKPFSESLLLKSGTVRHSLADDAHNAGLTNNMIFELEKIFSGKINFNRNLHAGDKFRILHQEFYLDGQKVKPGHIMAAQIQTKNKLYTAIRYTTPAGVSGYYDIDGHGLQPMLLRAPVHYTRISSPYSLRRWHPILHTWRPHFGVDYAAPANTPIHAAGDGKVTFVGQGHGFGNMVMISHPNHWTTVYAHMRRFAKNLHTRQYVQKGQTIGYVGMTGLATGPHVHYEIRHLGLRLNPRTTKLPGDKPIPWKARKDFKKHEKILLAELDLLKNQG